MKENKIAHRSRGSLWVTLGLVAATVILVGLAIGYEKLRSLYLEQCVITDKAEQVSVVSGKMVKPDYLAELFGLSNGANVACIDFVARRDDILRRIPTLRSLTVTCRPPNHVYIRPEERTPVARLNICGHRTVSGRVTDAEGMVFSRIPGTRLLPTIRETRAPGTAPGQYLKGRMRAALELVMACRDSAFSDLGILEVDTSKTDFLVATLGDYSRVKICWEDMDEATPAARAALEARLDMLLKVIRSRCEGLKAVIWNATLPDYIFADTQEKF